MKKKKIISRIADLLQSKSKSYNTMYKTMLTDNNTIDSKDTQTEDTSVSNLPPSLASASSASASLVNDFLYSLGSSGSDANRSWISESDLSSSMKYVPSAMKSALGDTLGDPDSLTNSLTNSYLTWATSTSPSYSYNNVVRTVIDIDKVDVKDYGVNVNFRDWLEGFIKKTLETEFLRLIDLKTSEITELKAEIIELKKLMEDVFEEAMVSKLEHLAQKDNK